MLGTVCRAASKLNRICTCKIGPLNAIIIIIIIVAIIIIATSTVVIIIIIIITIIISVVVIIIVIIIITVVSSVCIADKNNVLFTHLDSVPEKKVLMLFKCVSWLYIVTH